MNAQSQCVMMPDITADHSGPNVTTTQPRHLMDIPNLYKCKIIYEAGVYLNQTESSDVCSYVTDMRNNRGRRAEHHLLIDIDVILTLIRSPHSHSLMSSLCSRTGLL